MAERRHSIHFGPRRICVGTFDASGALVAIRCDDVSDAARARRLLLEWIAGHG